VRNIWGRPRRCCGTAGYSSPECETAKAELFNPPPVRFTATGSMTVSRSGHTGDGLLPDGRVLIAGGVLDFGAGGTSSRFPKVPGAASAELYDPVSGQVYLDRQHERGTLWAYSDVAGSTVPSWSPERATRRSYSTPGPETFSVVGGEVLNAAMRPSHGDTA